MITFKWATRALAGAGAALCLIGAAPALTTHDVPHSAAHEVAVTVVGARGLTNKDGLLGKSDPYAVVRMGNQRYQTASKTDAGASVEWNQTFTLLAEPGQELQVDVYDDDLLRDDVIGRVRIPEPPLGSVEGWYSITLGAKSAGEVHLIIKRI
ncbi:hypothetical protein ACIA6D_41295 [Streptomyces cacaoi]